ncbi:MAG TPA: hypothetical protein VN934_03560 [Candidatus Tumulicola sp.]|nr:hypothetical protein [Candidatus Tumulicola sp.]
MSNGKMRLKKALLDEVEDSTTGDRIFNKVVIEVLADIRDALVVVANGAGHIAASSHGKRKI